MLRTFIYYEQKNNWLEESHNLLSHDLCAFVDEERKTIYLWNGPHSSKKRLEKGYESAIDLVSNYPDDSLQLTVLLDEIPDKIQKKLSIMLRDTKKELKSHQLLFSTLTSIRLYIILSVFGILLPIFSILNLLNFVSSSGLTIKTINIIDYQNWLTISLSLMSIAITCIILTMLLGIYERDYQAIVISLTGIIACVGILIYLNQREFLFLFQGTTSTSYLIATQDITVFFGLNLFLDKF